MADGNGRSSRHGKITGDFGEALVLYLLSKHGYECAFIDHTGIDIIAAKPERIRIGVSVKSRCRDAGNRSSSVNISHDNFAKAQQACDAFGCEPYFAIVVDAVDVIRVYILSMEHLREIVRSGPRTSYWSMHPNEVQRYEQDPGITRFEFRAGSLDWNL